jgi:hypothetical protein
VLNIPHTERALTTYQVVDNLSWVRGSHVIRTGVNFRFMQHNDSRGLAGGFNLAPTVTFDSGVRAPAGFTGLPTVGATGINANDSTRLLNSINDLLGIPARITQGFISDPTADAFLPTGNIYNGGIRYKQFNYYAQDEWRVSPKLTLNYGFRWEVNLPATEGDGDFRPGAGAGDANPADGNFTRHRQTNRPGFPAPIACADHQTVVVLHACRCATGHGCERRRIRSEHQTADLSRLEPEHPA